VARYGEENARYLHEELTRHYGRLAYIRMGVEPDGRFEDQIRNEAAGRGWAFERIEGDMALLQQLVDGPWDDQRFVTVPPGWRLAVSHDESILRAERL
jgi:hypothetical protein